MTVIIVFTIFYKNIEVTMEQIKFLKSLFNLEFITKNRFFELSNKNIFIAFNMNGCFGSTQDLFYGIGNEKMVNFLYTNHFEVYCFEKDKECISYFQSFKNEGVDMNIHIGPEKIFVEKVSKRFTKTGKPKKDKIEYYLNIILEEIFNMPKFDLTIMNPPYGDLHLKILQEIKKHCPVVVNISPVRWLEDPCAKYNSKSDFNVYENSISKYIEKLQIIDMNEASKMFNTSFTFNLAIYYLTANGGYDYNSVWKFTTNENDFNKIKSFWNFPKLEFYSDNGYFIPVKKIVNPDRTTRFNIFSQEAKYFMNGYNPDGKKMVDTLYKSKSMNTDRTYVGIFVKTKTEAKNFYDSTFTIAYKYAVSLIKKDANVKINFLPFLENIINPRTGKIGYKSNWTNEDLCKVFGFTGYISDEKGRKNSDWDRILKIMEPYK